MSSAAASGPASQWSAVAYRQRHDTWPYKPSDFERSDPSSDDSFYSTPRFVTHIDDAAIASLRKYYDAVLPRKGRVLDFCSSYVSHYPPSVEKATESGDLKVVGMGMNQKELAANEVLNGGRILQDLNDDPTIPLNVCGEAAMGAMPSVSESSTEDALLDASTCVVSIDYLVRPVEVLTSLRKRTKKGGTVHLIISNRCFPTKAIGRWLRISEPERLMMVGDYLWFAGWRNIEIIDLKQNDQDDSPEQAQGSLQGLMKLMGMGGTDPLWAVRAVKQ